MYDTAGRQAFKEAGWPAVVLRGACSCGPATCSVRLWQALLGEASPWCQLAEQVGREGLAGVDARDVLRDDGKGVCKVQ